MKTIEEMKKDVSVYCQQIGSDGDFLIRDRLWLLQDFDGFTCQRQNKANQGTQVFAVNPNLDADDPHWAVAYVVLGLSERDAVAEKGQQCRQMIEATISAANEKIADLEAKNAALVAALGKIKEEHGYRYTYGDGFGNVTEKRLSSLGVAIDLVIKANEKGGRG